MSLINDALKRAKEAQPSHAPPLPPPSPMQPAEHRRGNGLPIYFTPIFLAILCGAAFFLLKGWEEHRRLTAQLDPMVVKARELSVSDDASDATPDESPPGIPQGRNFSLEDGPPKASTAVAAMVGGDPSDPRARSANPPHTYRLQAVFYRSANPSAVINGKTVYIGERVSNARVKMIDRESVTIEHDGSTEVLTLP
jgi:hypothetical protein